MEKYLNDLHEMCETLCRALKEANEKIRAGGGKVSTTDLDYINKLTHSMKSVKGTIAMIESEMDDGGSYDSGSYRGRSYRGGSYRGSYDDGSYRGRGPYAYRDNMGRYASHYSRDGYSMHGSMADELRELMQDAPDEQTRQEFQRLIQKMEQR